MNFEESLVFELSATDGLNGKVFPLGAKEGTVPPFVVYVSSAGEETQALEGYTSDKSVTCEIHIVGGTYSEMKTVTQEVLDRIKSFFGRQIGVNGPFVKSVSYDEPHEEHIEELNFERCAFDIHVRI